jgi:SulP family sulfate permease
VTGCVPICWAGGVVAALAVPQALGYAAIAGVPVELGLYTVPIALIAYAIFGSSRQLVVGPVSTVSVLSGSLVAALGPTDAAQAIAFTTGAALWAGVLLLIAAHLRISWVAEFLSKPIVTGFVLGLTLLVILGERPACWASRSVRGTWSAGSADWSAAWVRSTRSRWGSPRSRR